MMAPTKRDQAPTRRQAMPRRLQASQRSPFIQTASPYRDPQPQQMWTSIPPPPLPHFDGTGPVETFIEEARRVVKAHRLEPSIAAEFIIRHLRGSARDEILARGASTPQDIFDALNKAFGDDRSLPCLVQAFHRRQQGLGESVLDYGLALEAIANKANREKNGAIDADALRFQFIDGLQPTALRRDMKAYMRNHPTLAFLEVRQEAMRWMREGQTAATEAISSTNEIEDLRREMTNAFAQLREELRRPTSGNKAANVVCYYCRKSGHMIKDCKKKKFLDQKQRQDSRNGGNYYRDARQAHAQQNFPEARFHPQPVDHPSSSYRGYTSAPHWLPAPSAPRWTGPQLPPGAAVQHPLPVPSTQEQQEN